VVNLVKAFADARGFREKAKRADRLAGTTKGTVQAELDQLRGATSASPTASSPHQAAAADTQKIKGAARACV
jgi:hypothetical protein